ncbi:MAG: hypothetical protein RJA81_2370 [Planctomycetota bacterium]|jgi:non-specific serine/threonine protein kinase
MVDDIADSFELMITPRGHLVVRKDLTVGESDPDFSEIREAFRESTARGLLVLAGDQSMQSLSPTFGFGRMVARLYFSALCRAVIKENLDVETAAVADLIVSPTDDLERIMLQAPPMMGLEYLNKKVIESWWRDLDLLVHEEISQNSGNLKSYLQKHNSQWRYIGRVTFHLAENKRNPDYPFAFLATYSDGLTESGKVRHEPFAKVLQQYAGERNREAMLTLLLPVSRAAEKLDWVGRLLETGGIYRPLAWSPAEAHRFLKSVPELESSGLIVRVPDWWNVQKSSRPLVNVKIDTKEKAVVGVDTLLNFSIDLSLGGETLDRDEIQQLLESTGGLVSIKGRWVEVDAQKLKDALEQWKQVQRRVQREGISFYEGMRLLAGVPSGAMGSGLQVSEVREWTGLSVGPKLETVLSTLRSPEFHQENAPAGLKAQLRPYQVIGYTWLRFITRLGLGGCLADDMGLGKTLQVIALLLDMRRHTDSRASLLVVPASLVANWKAELSRFAPEIQYAVVHPSELAGGKEPITPESAGRFDLIITTYSMMVRTEWLVKYRWQLVVLDEAQAIKNSGTKQASVARKLQSDARIAMTGTPIENRLSDLWSLFDFLNPGLLGSSKQFGAFVKRMQDGPEASFEPLRRLIGPYILRRLKTDKSIIADLPDKIETTAYCLLSKAQAALYQKSVNEMAKLLDSCEEGIQRRGIVLSQLMKLKQICNHPAQLTGSNDFRADQSGKFHRLAEIAEQISSRQEKLLVFTQFREMTEPLAAFLATIFGRNGLVLHGSTAVKKRQELVNQFQSESGPPFFVISIKAGGTGLNLTAAAHVVHFDRWWNPAIENQATDRAFRIGQRKNVLVHKFVCRGTLEERIDEMICQKNTMAADAIGEDRSGEFLLTEMDNATLMKWVALDLNQLSEN